MKNRMIILTLSARLDLTVRIKKGHFTCFNYTGQNCRVFFYFLSLYLLSKFYYLANCFLSYGCIIIVVFNNSVVLYLFFEDK